MTKNEVLDAINTFVKLQIDKGVARSEITDDLQDVQDEIEKLIDCM